MADGEGDLLVMLLDSLVLTPPAASDAYATTSGRYNNGSSDVLNATAAGSMLSQVLAFANAYALLHKQNQLAVFALHESGCHLVYERFEGGSSSTSSALHSAAAANIGNGHTSTNPSAPAFVPASAVPSASLHANVRALIDAEQAGTGGAITELALSGGLSRALCLLHRLKGSPGRARARNKPRILALVARPDAPMQYIPVMNAIFSAQRADVAIDACVVHCPSDSAFLQQAAHLTGGAYFRPKHPAALYEYLVSFFATDTSVREMLDVPQALGVDFRAACFCHKRTIDIGFVCSVCLSIFCTESPTCSTCGTTFGAAGIKASAAAGGSASGAP